MPWRAAPTLRRAVPGLAALLLASAAALAGDPPPDRALSASLRAAHVPSVDAVTLAGRIRAREPDLRLFDVHPTPATSPPLIPTAVHVSADTTDRIAKGGSIVVYAEEQDDALGLALALRDRGDDAAVLRGGAAAWIEDVLEPRLYLDATPADTQAYRRAAEVSRYFGGQPRAGVPRPAPSDVAETPGQAAERIRRRGCSD